MCEVLPPPIDFLPPPIDFSACAIDISLAEQFHEHDPLRWRAQTDACTRFFDAFPHMADMRPFEAWTNGAAVRHYERAAGGGLLVDDEEACDDCYGSGRRQRQAVEGTVADDGGNCAGTALHTDKSDGTLVKPEWFDTAAQEMEMTDGMEVLALITQWAPAEWLRTRKRLTAGKDVEKDYSSAVFTMSMNIIVGAPCKGGGFGYIADVRTQNRTLWPSPAGPPRSAFESVHTDVARPQVAQVAPDDDQRRLQGVHQVHDEA